MLIDTIKKSLVLKEKYTNSSVSEKRLEELEYLRDQLKSISPSLIAIHNNNNDLSIINQGKLEEVEQINITLMDLKENIHTVSKDQIVVVLKNLEYHKNQSINKLSMLWSEYKSEKFAKNSNLIHSLLIVIDQNDPRLDEIGILQKAINEKRIGNVETKKQIDNYKKLTDDILHDLKMEDCVEDFLFKLSRGEDVVLEDINETTMEWLTEHKMTKKIKLSI